MLHFMKSAPSQGQVNSPTARPGPRTLALLRVPPADPRPWAPLPENGLWGRGAAVDQALGEGVTGPRAWQWASSQPPHTAAPCCVLALC